ncbi:amino acid adenylation domain-containing protein [Amycolatopsis sp. lyj-112]|uniref:non-ribosomal peptide synthetase n=1 Tax=Amycolatopsis sp. lyj-112 TaxID=2789288 RepID=UPI0039788EC4
MTTNGIDRAVPGPEATMREVWIALAAEVIGCSVETVRDEADEESFIDLGGTSLRAADFLARVERQLGISVPLRALRGPVPLAQAMAQATEYRPIAPATAPSTSPSRPVSPGQEDTMREEWIALAAEVIGCSVETVRDEADEESFIDLGGTSLRAADFLARVERQLGISVPLRALRGSIPLAQAMAQATDYRPTLTGASATTEYRPMLPSQEGMLMADGLFGGRGVHVLFTAESSTPFDPDRLRAALADLTRNHEALRTFFANTDTGFARRVLDSWEPRLLEQRLSPPPGMNPVEVVHNQLGEASPGLLSSFTEPPVLFVHTKVDGGPDLLSIVLHHALLDGWALARFWHLFARAYVDGSTEPGLSPDLIGSRFQELTDSGRLNELKGTVLEYLSGLSDVVKLPVDRVRPEVQDVTGVRLPFSISSELRDKVMTTARRLGVTHTVVLFTAWAVVVARRTGLKDLAIGVGMSGRQTAEMLEVLGLCVRIVPIRCRLDDDQTVDELLSAAGAGWAEAAERDEFPLEQIIPDLGEDYVPDGLPMVQAVFEAHDELVGEPVRAGELELTLHEGYCGASMMETTFFVAAWGERPVLRLEYQPAVFGPGEAADIVEGFTAALEGLVTDSEAPVSSVLAISPRQRERLLALSDGPAVDCEAGLWQSFQETAERYPDAIAVETLTYADLLAAVRTHAAALTDVGPGDRVVLSVPRGVAEVVAVLAVLHRGAAYVAVDAAAPQEYVSEILQQVSPRLVIGSPEVAELAGCPLVPLWTPADPMVPGPKPAPADPDRTAYITFTSGSTGRPKGVIASHRAVVRLVRDSGYIRRGPGERLLRLAPLAFDGSTVELFVPLLSGAAVQVFPDGPVGTTELAQFLVDRRVSVLFLTVGLFRLVAEHRPEGFAYVRQVLTGGDVVPSAQVRQLLDRYPELRVSNVYGPTECTAFTTFHHMDSVAAVSDPLPIGKPIPGTRVFVLDEDGNLVPPGAAGELCVGGPALADGYLDAPDETARAFGWRAPDTGERLYRTGDLVRWDGRGRLAFLGRRDHQIKVSGFRIEPAAVARRLNEHPKVRDVVVTGTGTGTERRLLAGVIVTDPSVSVAELRAWVGETLPSWSVPELWSLGDAFPLTPNAKVDLQALATRAAA